MLLFCGVSLWMSHTTKVMFVCRQAVLTFGFERLLAAVRFPSVSLLLSQHPCNPGALACFTKALERNGGLVRNLVSNQRIRILY